MVHEETLAKLPNYFRNRRNPDDMVIYLLNIFRQLTLGDFPVFLSKGFKYDFLCMHLSR